jgi:hypothetical protein
MNQKITMQFNQKAIEIAVLQCTNSLEFYKNICQQIEEFSVKNGATNEELVGLDESDADMVDFIKGSTGFFVSYENSFARWIHHGYDFNVGHITDALRAFERINVSTQETKIIFKALEDSIKLLGEYNLPRSNRLRNIISGLNF